MIDDTKLDAPTLRWAAAHIRKFVGGKPISNPLPVMAPGEWDRDMAVEVQSDAFADAFEFAAESMDNWATETEMTAAKREAEKACASQSKGYSPHPEADPPLDPPGTHVAIVENTETGDHLWSICRATDPEYWIWSYDTEADAMAACKRHGWEVTGVTRMPDWMREE